MEAALEVISKFFLVVAALQFGVPSMIALVIHFYYKKCFEEQFYLAFMVMLPYAAIGFSAMSILALLIVNAGA